MVKVGYMVVGAVGSLISFIITIYMVTKDTASAIDKFTKNSEQLGVPPISELIRVNCNLFWTKQGSFLITESANLRKVVIYV